MRNFNRVCLLAFLAGCLLGCEEYIDPPFEIEESRLIISSNFAPDEKVSVRVTASEPVAGMARSGEITNASISIYEGEDLVETLAYRAGEEGRPGLYCTNVFEPEVGIPYSIKVSAPGFTPVTASSSIPMATVITRLEVSDLEVSRSASNHHIYNFGLLVDYVDPEFENFYDLRIRQQVHPYYVSSGTQDTVFLDPVYKTVESLTSKTEENTQRGESSYLIADRPEGGIDIQLISKVNPRTEILGDLVVELRTVSRDYYNFQVAIQQEQRIYNMYFERAVNSSAFSNVGGGYGIFAGYSTVTRVFPLVD